MRSGPWGKAVAERIEAALDDLVRQLRADAAVAALIVFGSYARGDFARKSDLDLLILLHAAGSAERNDAERRVVRAVVEAESDHRLPVHLAPLVTEATRPEELGSALLHNIWTDGVILYGEASALAPRQPRGLAPWSVVRFSLAGVPARERVRLAHHLHGTETRPGLIHLPGLNLARGAAFLSANQIRSVQNALDEAGATYDIIPVWWEA